MYHVYPYILRDEIEARMVLRRCRAKCKPRKFTAVEVSTMPLLGLSAYRVQKVIVQLSTKRDMKNSKKYMYMHHQQWRIENQLEKLENDTEAGIISWGFVLPKIRSPFLGSPHNPGYFYWGI